MTAQSHHARSFAAALVLALTSPLVSPVAFGQDIEDTPSRFPLTVETFAPRIEELARHTGTDAVGQALARELALATVRSPSAALAREKAAARATLVRFGAEAFARADGVLAGVANPRGLGGVRGASAIRSSLLDVVADPGLRVDAATRLSVLEREAGRAIDDQALDSLFLAGNLKALNALVRFEGVKSPRLERAANAAMGARAGRTGSLEALAQEVEGLDADLGARLRSTHRVFPRPQPQPTPPQRP